MADTLADADTANSAEADVFSAIRSRDTGRLALAVILFYDHGMMPAQSVFAHYAVHVGHATDAVLRTLLSFPVTIEPSKLHGSECAQGLLECATRNCRTETVTALLAYPDVVETLTSNSALLCVRLLNALLRSSASLEALEALHAFLACPAVAAVAGNGDEGGVTPLMVAVRTSFADYARRLLDCPAVVKTAGAIAHDGSTVLRTALSIDFRSDNVVGQSERHVILKHLLTTCPAILDTAFSSEEEGSKLLRAAVTLNEFPLFRALLARPEFAEIAGSFSSHASESTLLMFASSLKRHDFVRELLALASVAETATRRNADGNSALSLTMRSLRGSRIDTVRELLACRAIAESAATDVTNDGKTPLFFACESTYHTAHTNPCDQALLLKALFACPGVEDSAATAHVNGATALTRASHSRCVHVRKAALEHLSLK